MKYPKHPPEWESGLKLRDDELKYMHWQVKQIAKSVWTYKNTPQQHDEHMFAWRAYWSPRLYYSPNTFTAGEK